MPMPASIFHIQLVRLASSWSWNQNLKMQYPCCLHLQKLTLLPAKNAGLPRFSKEI